MSLDAPYFIEYRVRRNQLFRDGDPRRIDRQRRVFGPDSDWSKCAWATTTFDNTNHLYSDAYSGTRYDPDQLPLDDDYLAFRHALWLATDRAYKTAEDAIARKRSSLKNMNLPEQLPDFSKAPRVEAVLPVRKQTVNESCGKTVW